MQQCEDNNIEKSENLKRIFVELVLQTRKIYLEHHEKNPGFFSLVVIFIYIYSSYTTCTSIEIFNFV